jgi:hypothetical protein
MRHKNHSIRILIGSLIIAAAPLSGAVIILVREGHPLVEGVYVNGHGPYRFLLDTGSNTNLIDEKLAQSIGLKASFRSELASSTGVTVAPGSNDVQVVLDSQKSEPQKFLFLRLAFHDRWPDVKGVLGQEFLWKLDYTLDLRAKQLTFGKLDQPGTRIPYRLINGRMAVSTNLGALVLDSGTDRLVLFGIKADLGVADEREMRTFTGSQKIGMAFRKLLTIEGRRIWQGAAVAIPNQPEPEVDGLLPLGLFRAIYVSNSEGYMVLQ